MKALHFNKYFASKNCYLWSIPEFHSQASISSLNVVENDLSKPERALDIKKAQGHDEIAIWMIKICDEALVKS